MVQVSEGCRDTRLRHIDHLHFDSEIRALVYDNARLALLGNLDVGHVNFERMISIRVAVCETTRRTKQQRIGWQSLLIIRPNLSL